MSVIIRNLGTNPKPTGKHRYELRINDQVLCEFAHKREDGLAQCLIAAAKAYERDKWQGLADMLKEGG
jgi:hypothetical protein